MPAEIYGGTFEAISDVDRSIPPVKVYVTQEVMPAWVPPSEPCWIDTQQRRRITSLKRLSSKIECSGRLCNQAHGIAIADL